MLGRIVCLPLPAICDEVTSTDQYKCLNLHNKQHNTALPKVAVFLILSIHIEKLESPSLIYLYVLPQVFQRINGIHDFQRNEQSKHGNRSESNNKSLTKKIKVVHAVFAAHTHRHRNEVTLDNSILQHSARSYTD